MTGEVAVKERVQIEKSFQEEEDCRVLLLTVGVGGVGLNLTAASHVIHFDRCYNPAKEQQATDRTHRLGQRNAVCVHAFVTTGSFEERLDEIMREKAELSNLTVTSADDWIANYNDEEVRELFMLRSSSSGTRGPQRQSSTASGSNGGQKKGGRRKRVFLEDVDENPVANDSVATALTPPKKPRIAQASSVTPVSVKSLSQAESEEECSICMDGLATHLVLPCGHRCLCEDCMDLVERCPLCRVDIKKRIRISREYSSKCSI